MPTVYSRATHDVAGVISGSGIQVITDRIQALDGIAAPTPSVIQYAQAMEAEDTYRIRWRKKDAFPHTLTVNGALVAGDLTLVVDEIDYIQEGQTLYTPNDEWIRATALNSTANSATIERGFAGTTAAAIADNAVLIIGPPAYKDGEAPGRTPHSRAEFEHNNFLDAGWMFDENDVATAIPSWFTDGNNTEMAQSKLDLLDQQVMRQFEMITWYGERQQGTGTAEGFFRGIANFITTNTSSSVGTLTMTDIYDHINTIRKNKGASDDGSVVRTLVGNDGMQRVVSSLIRSYSSAWERVNEPTNVNAMTTGFQTDIGRVNFMLVDQLRDGELYIVDFSDMRYVPLDIKGGLGAGWVEMTRTPQNTGVRKTEWHYYYNGSFVVGNEQNHAKLTGVTVTAGSYANYI